MTDFTNTRKALQVWDDTAFARDTNWGKTSVATDGWEDAIRVAEEEDAKAAELVHQAFFEDTKAFNSLDRCRLVFPDDPWLRNLVKGT